MIQCLLPFYAEGPETYTEVSAEKRRRYAEKGEGLVRRAFRLMEDVKTGAQAVPISELNDVSLELSSLEPLWFDFSTACFSATLNYLYNSTVNCYGDLKKAFDATVAQIAAGS